MAPVDPYRVLQVHPEADLEIIQVAYRKLAQRYHPDVVPGPEAARRMAELNAARDLLCDPDARAAYDRSRRMSEAAARAPARPRAAEPPAGAAPVARRTAPEAAAGPPPGNPSGSVLSFGRYASWSLGEIARRDLEYVEWLDRMPIGRPYREEIDALLRRAGRRGGAAPREEPRGLYRRR
jgi:curved DNA-binding protein CbpA